MAVVDANTFKIEVVILLVLSIALLVFGGKIRSDLSYCHRNECTS